MHAFFWMSKVAGAVCSQRRSTTRRRKRGLAFEPLRPRLTPAVTAFFSPGTALLSIIGDSLDNTITVHRDVAGTILVNNGAVAIQGGTPTVANTNLIRIFGQAGNDNLLINETNGAMPAAFMFGASGNDTLRGGVGNDRLIGQAGNDQLLGKGGADLLIGGSENDVLTGGDGDDQVFGQTGNDRFVWNPGDDTDLNEGGGGSDIIEVNGGSGAEVFTTTANGARVRFDRLDPAPFFLDIGTSENLVLNANGGEDNFAATGNLAALIQVTVDGGGGNDTLLGTNGIDLLLGGDGNDFIDGQQGNDVAFLGAGDDVFQWDPGDGSDVLEGQDGRDRMLFNGSGANENIAASANGGRILFTRDVASIVMDLNDVEVLDYNAVGGTDTITINDLSGTDVVDVNLNLSAVGGGGDAAIDTVIVQGSADDDIISIASNGSAVDVSGLAASVHVLNAESTDKLTVNSLAGSDVIDATALLAASLLFSADGGDGDDALLGGEGDDTLLGGNDDDVLIGGPGNDTLDGGTGDNVLIQ